MINLEKLIRYAVETGASDIHLKVGNYPFIRVEGQLQPLEDFDLVRREDTVAIVEEILNRRQKQILADKSEVDLSFGLEGLGRFRLAVFYQRGTIALAFRLIPTSVPTIEELNLPPVLKDIADSQRGLVLVTGVTGSGKSTTLASMIRYLNETRRCNIITIEDPIEFLLPDKLSIISQRETSSDTRDFASALRAAMRQDPDVIMVGEMRDQETVLIALQAAQTGHLVLSTLHTTDAVTTVDRVIAMFPVAQQRDIRFQLASALNAVISMRLIRSSITGKRIPAVEVLRNTELVSSLITQPERTKEIRHAMETGFTQYKMQTFDQSIFNHYQEGLISREDALRYATAPEDLKLKIQGIVTSADMV
ncbi:MAG: type IV pilus twitching motility protein PilT [Acidobacteriota bacterium]